MVAHTGFLTTARLLSEAAKGSKLDRDQEESLVGDPDAP
jgi:hypothetical protein